jgi:hypothetical protein
MKILLIVFFVALTGVTSKPPFTVPYVGLTLIGTINSVNDEGTNYEKKIYLSNFLVAKPLYARSVCKSFGANMDIASFENRAELQKIQSKLSLEMNRNQPESTLAYGVTIGGMAHFINERKHFFWTTTGLKVDQSVLNDQSDNCMSLKKSAGNLLFTAVPCDKEYTFVCQHLEFIYAN